MDCYETNYNTTDGVSSTTKHILYFIVLYYGNNIVRYYILI